MDGGVDDVRSGCPGLDLSTRGGARPKGAAGTRVIFWNPSFPFSILDDVFNRLDERDMCTLDLERCGGGDGSCRPGFLAAIDSSPTHPINGCRGARPSSYHIFQTPWCPGNGLALWPRHFHRCLWCVSCVVSPRHRFAHAVLRGV